MDLATLEEANRLRESMGLKPLSIPGQAPPPKGSDDEDEDPLATLDGRHAAAFDNFKKAQDVELAKRRREEKAEAVKRAREKAQRHALLQGKTLGDLDDGEGDGIGAGAAEGDAKAWLRGQKKRQKKIGKVEAAQRARDEAAADTARRREEELSGVKVGHDMAALLDGDDQILTLRDATVLENEDEGDELENLGLREQERLQERLDLKKKRLAYNPMDDDDDGAGERTVLGQYDEEIFGKKRKHFTLDPNAILGLGGGDKSSSGAAAAGAAAGASGSIPGVRLAGEQQNLAGLDDILSGVPSSDYLDASEIKIKKPKKKKTKTKKTRTRGGEDDEGLFPAGAENGDAAQEDDSNDQQQNGDEAAQMDVVDDGSAAAAAADPAASNRRKRKALDAEELFRDEDDLQAALAAQRREALKKRKRTRPEDFAKQLRETSAAPDGDGESGNGGEDGGGAGGAPTTGGLVIDETAEFISNLKRREDREDEAPRPKKQAAARASSVTAMEEEAGGEDGDDVAMRDEDEDEDEDGDGGDARNEREGSGGDASHLGGAGLEEEKKISEGMGATLSILRGRGILDGEGEGGGSSSSAERNAAVRASQKFVTEKRVRLAQLDDEARRRREHDRAAGGALARMSVREREEYARKQNAQREFQTSRMLQDMFNKSYTPSFSLEYVDEHGRELNQKEAFRELSHGFHGKTSGRGKTDKMLKRIEAEKRHMAEGILDASQNVGMSSAAAQQLKKRKEAGVRLD